MIYLMPSRAVAVELFGFGIRWYGVMYIAAFALAMMLLPRLQRWRGLSLTREQWLEVVAWGAVGALIGGRLGYVLLYEPLYYLAHPGQILALWQGGMAAHGGLIGVGFALWLVSRQLKVDFLTLLDVAVVPAALGLALGRLGNVINQELFPAGWPQALAVLKNLAVATLVYWYLRYAGRFKSKSIPSGAALALFLVSYGALRFAMEYVRIQDYSSSLGLTRGQWYSLPVIALGVGLYFYVAKRS